MTRKVRDRELRPGDLCDLSLIDEENGLFKGKPYPQHPRDPNFFLYTATQVEYREDGRYPLESLVRQNVQHFEGRWESLYFYYDGLMVPFLLLRSSPLQSAHINVVYHKFIPNLKIVPATSLQPGQREAEFVSHFWKGPRKEDLCFKSSPNRTDILYACVGDPAVYVVRQRGNEGVEVNVSEIMRDFVYRNILHEIDNSSLTPGFSRLDLYEDRADDVAARMWSAHSVRVKELLQGKTKVCAPADGPGLVGMQFEGSIVGDKFPPSYSKVSAEVMEDTVRRGIANECDVIMLSYCHPFITESCWEEILSYSWEIIMLGPGVFSKEGMIYEGGGVTRREKVIKPLDPPILCEEEPVPETTVVNTQVDRVKVPNGVRFSDNFLAVVDPVFVRCDEYSIYSLFMRPGSIVVTESELVRKNFESFGIRAVVGEGTRILSHWEDLIYYRRGYLAYTGKWENIDEAKEILSEPVSLSVRTLYKMRAPVVKWKQKLVKHVFLYMYRNYAFFLYPSDEPRGMYGDREVLGPPQVCAGRKDVLWVRDGKLSLEIVIAEIIGRMELMASLVEKWPSFASSLYAKLLSDARVRKRLGTVPVTT